MHGAHLRLCSPPARPHRACFRSEFATRRRIDEASKLLFTGQVFADALRAALPELAELLRLEDIEPLPTEYVSRKRRKRFGDAAFRVKFKKGRFPPPRPSDGEGRGRRLYLLLAGEFQHRNDPRMLRRVQRYAARMEQHYRHQGVVRGGEWPPILALVIHTGAARWTAADGAEVYRSCRESRRAR